MRKLIAVIIALTAVLLCCRAFPDAVQAKDSDGDVVIVIDAGHGGDDPGAVANGLQEKDLTLEVSQYMYDRFQQLGAPVTLIRQMDETISPEERVRRILEAYGDDPNVIVISNHINAGGGDGQSVTNIKYNN